MTEVTTWYLEQLRSDTVLPVDNPGGLRIEEARVPQFQFNRFLYQLVGGKWAWTDKLSWSEEQWRDYAERDTLRTWAAWRDGSPAGYFELERESGGRVEINYFGLAGKFIGRGFGGWLLSQAIENAWSWQASRVIVNTCSLDHPSALANYQARGMTLYRTEQESG